MNTTGKILLATALAAMPLLSAAEIYKYVDENGVTRYTDKPPSKEAKPVVLPPLQTYTGAGISPTVEAPATEDVPEPPKQASYQGIELVSPTDNTVFQGASPSVRASAVVNPGLAQGDRVVFLVDGRSFPAPEGQTSLELNELERGSHSLQAVVMDAQDNIQVQSQVVNFQLSQPSILQPNPINALPRPP